MRDAERDREFAAFLGGRGTPLLRSAYLLTGDLAEAERTLVDAAARTCLDWKRIQPSGDPEAYLLGQLVTGWKPSGGSTNDAGDSGDQPSPAPSEDSEEVDPDALDREHIWRAYLALQPTHRVVLVLGIHEQLDEEEIARLTRRSPRATRADIERALSALRAGADPVGHQAARTLAERLTAAFTAREVAVRADRTLVDRSLARAGALARSRRRLSVAAAGVVLACAAIVAVAVALTAPDNDSATGSGSPTPTAPDSALPTPASSGPDQSVVAIPDAVLALARTERVLLGYDSAIVDGATDPVTVLVRADPATGASAGGQIVGLARAEGGYVVLTRPTVGTGQVLTLAYVPRTGRRVELGHVGLATPGFAVSPDGLSVVHVIPGPVDGESSLGPGQTQLVIQTLSGEVLNRVTEDGPTYPMALDADRVWYERPVDPVGAPYAWNRVVGTVQRLKVPTGLVGLAVHGNQVLMHADSSDGCFSYYDGSDPFHPVRRWRTCTGAASAAFAPSGAQVALLTGDHPAFVLFVNAADGQILGEAVTDTAQYVDMEWAADGVKLLVQTRDPAGEQNSVIVITPAPGSASPAPAQTYQLGPDSVVLGRELPIP